MAVGFVLAEVFHFFQGQIAVDVAGFVDIAVVVVDQIAILGQIQIAFQNVHTDGVHSLPEGKQGVFRIAGAAAAMGRDHRQLPFFHKEGIGFHIFLGRNEVNDSKKYQNRCQNDADDG